MARSNLLCSAELKAGFLEAQSGLVRFMKLHINDKNESIELVSTHPTTGDGNDVAFSSIAQHLVTNEACFVLFCINVGVVGGLRWVLVAFVPENCKVRHKMLYASSREDLKVQLGLGYFECEYYANEVAEISYALFLESRKKDAAAAPLTESEKMVLEEKKMERDTSIRSTAMGVVPFIVSATLGEKLVAFNRSGDNFLEMMLHNDSETIELVSSASLILRGEGSVSLVERLNDSEPRFIAVRYPRSTAGSDGETKFLVFVCPETAPVRLKMIYSTAKATLKTIAEQMGIIFDKVVEIRGSDEADEVLDAETRGTGSIGAQSDSGFARPSRPGRGRARIIRGGGRG